MNERITFNPNIMEGRACIRNIRIPVKLVLSLLANGKSISDILQDYPYLEEEDIKACLEYAVWLADDKIIPVKYNIL